MASWGSSRSSELPHKARRLEEQRVPPFGGGKGVGAGKGGGGFSCSGGPGYGHGGGKGRGLGGGGWDAPPPVNMKPGGKGGHHGGGLSHHGGGSKGSGSSGGKCGGRGGGSGSSSSASGYGPRGGDPLALAKTVADLDALAPDTALLVDPLSDEADATSAVLRELLVEGPRGGAIRSLRIETTKSGGGGGGGGGGGSRSSSSSSSSGSGSDAQAPLTTRDEHDHVRWLAIALLPLSDNGPAISTHLISLCLIGLPLVTSLALAPIGDLTRLRSLRVEDSPGLVCIPLAAQPTSASIALYLAPALALACSAAAIPRTERRSLLAPSVSAADGSVPRAPAPHLAPAALIQRLHRA